MEYCGLASLQGYPVALADWRREVTVKKPQCLSGTTDASVVAIPFSDENRDGPFELEAD